MFYGFGSRRKHDAIFKVKAPLDNIRLTDYALRQIMSGAIESTRWDAFRHQFSECLEKVVDGLASFITWCARYRGLRLLARVLTPLLFLMGKWHTRVQNNDINKRKYVKDADGHYVLMAPVGHEHVVRNILVQLKVETVSETFPPDVGRFPKPEKGQGSATFTFNVAGRPFTLDIWG